MSMRIALICCSLLLSLLLVADTVIAVGDPLTNLQECIEGDVDVSVDYFPDKAVIEHSQLFEISYHKTYKIITNLQAGVTYCLYQCGTEPPQDQMDGRHQLVLPTPLSGVVVTSTTQIPHLELLGLRRKIVAYAGNVDDITSSCLRDLIDQKEIEVIYDPASPWSPPIAAWLENNADAVVIGSPWDSPKAPNYFIFSESQEKASNKAVFEWHKAIAALFNLEKMATATVDETNNRYDCITENAAVVASDREPPTVLWAYYSTYENGWDVAECPNYYCEFAEHCSATLVTDPAAKLNILNDSEFLEVGKDADFWIFPSPGWDALYNSSKELLDQFKSVQNNQVYDNQGSGQKAWFEQRLAEFDVVLLDFCDVVGHGSPTGQLHQKKWFRHVESGETVEPASCDPSEIDAPWETRSSECITLTRSPTQSPAPSISSSPTKAPTTPEPTFPPTNPKPTAIPTDAPTKMPTESPVISPTSEPSEASGARSRALPVVTWACVWVVLTSLLV